MFCVEFSDELSDPYATDEESDYIPDSDTSDDDVDGTTERSSQVPGLSGE